MHHSASGAVRFDKTDKRLFPTSPREPQAAGFLDGVVHAEGNEDVLSDLSSRVGSVVAAVTEVAADQDRSRERAIANWCVSCVCSTASELQKCAIRRFRPA